MTKFLFYTEPFPVRNEFTHFCNVWDNIAVALDKKNDEYDFSIYGNLDTLVEIQKKHSDWEKYFTLPTKEESALFNSCLTDWDNGGIEQWQELMRDSQLSQEYIRLIKNVHRRYPFDHIVCWGTNYAVKQAAKELNVGFIDMELGCSRLPFMDSLVADPWGVNGAAVLAHSDISDFENVRESDVRTDFLFSNGIKSDAYEAMFAYTNSSELLNKIGNQKIAFIALQLYDDANMIEYSRFSDVEDVLRTVLPALKQAGYCCIVKEHPASNVRHGSEYANLKAKMYALDFDNVIWLTARDKIISNSILFKMSDVVITVNSSSGFEALYYEKPVIVLGDAVYNVANVFPTLDEFLNEQFDYDAYLHKIRKIRHFFLQSYLIPHPQSGKTDGFFPYLRFIGDMSKQKMTTRQIIDAFLNYERLKNV